MGTNAASQMPTPAVDDDLVQVLERTIQARVLKVLEDPLAEVVNDAIRKAMRASKEAPRTRRRSRKADLRPSSGGKCAQVWKTLDSETAKRDRPPSLQEVKKLAKRKRWNDNTARIQYYRWRSAQQTAAA